MRRFLRLLGAALPVLTLTALSAELVGCGFVVDFTTLVGMKSKKKKKVSSSSDEAEETDEERSGRVQLGKAVYPAGAKTPVANYQWTAARLQPTDYEIAYVLSADEQKRIIEAHHAFARSVNFTPVDETKFRWTIPKGCEPDMGCAFGAMTDASQGAMTPLVELFKTHARREKLKSDEVASLIVTFVQSIRYERPKDHPFEILPPASVVAEKRGDCDSKSLLAHLLLREFGIDSVMLSSRAHGHAMLGVGIPAPGKHQFKFGGHVYSFTELTAPNSPIGHINDELLRPDDWRVVPTRWPSASR